MIYTDVGPGRGHILVGMLVGLMILLAALIGNTASTEVQQRTAARWYAHTLDVLLVTGRMRSGLHASTEDDYGFIITGDTRFEAQLRRVNEQARLLSTQFGRLTADNPQQAINVSHYRPELRNFNEALDVPVRLVRDDDVRHAVALVRGGILQQRLSRLLASLNDMEREERRLLVLRHAVLQNAARKNQTSKWLLFVSAAGFIALTAFAALALQRSRKRLVEVSDQLHHLAITNPLTELSNRRRFEERFDQEIARASHTAAPVCLAFIDIDHFKTINDRFGHQAGDMVLYEVARVTRDEMRVHDEVGRLGGEEFGILMTGTHDVEAARMCERLRTVIAGRTIATGANETVTVTVSIGLACLSPGKDRASIMRRPDQALYGAKASGRNRLYRG